MNNIFKIVFSKSRGEFIVASELAKGKTKSSTNKAKTTTSIASLFSIPLLSLGVTLAAAPVGETVYLKDYYNAAQLNWTDDKKITQQETTLISRRRILSF